MARRRTAGLVARFALAVLAVLTIADPVRAQSRPARPTTPRLRDRIWVSVNAGFRPAGNRTSDSFDLPLNAETEHVAVEYPANTGVALVASVAYRLRNRLFVGGGVSNDASSGSANVSASLPHPFLVNTPRTIEGTTHTTAGETGLHAFVGWMVPLSRHARLLLSAGPSVVTIRQRLVTDVSFSEAYPYDSAIFTGATTRPASGRSAGLNAGADLFWMRWRKVGVGALVQVTHASVQEHGAGDRTVTVDALSVRAAAGIRVFLGK